MAIGLIGYDTREEANNITWFVKIPQNHYYWN